jgi:hypothetical protein
MSLPYDDMPLEVRRANFGWWGEPWPSGICLKQDESGADILPYEWNWDMNVPVPVGEKCFSCGEEIVATDQGQRMPFAHDGGVELVNQHKECGLRNVMGPLAHLERRCRCFGGTDHDTPGLTKRQEALAVWEWITEHGVPSGP